MSYLHPEEEEGQPQTDKQTLAMQANLLNKVYNSICVSVCLCMFEFPPNY